ncbi:MAG: cation transporter [Treponema sp.]|nr:cation transporter [Treponema sp.]
MITLLSRLFIKNYKDVKNPDVRSAYGILCGALGIFLNIFLFLIKFFFGKISGSLSLIADAFNSLSDAASSLVSIIGFKLSNKESDSGHPFGHGRLEYISGLIISFFILMMSFELLKSSINSIINPKPIEVSGALFIILIISILVKFYMYFYNNSVAKKIDSIAMQATAKDSFSDVLSTLVVIITIITSKFTTFPVDGIGGIIVSLFILKTGIDSAKETIDPLLGKAPEKEMVEQIKTELLKFKPIVGMHDLIIHDYGPGRFMISLHAEVPGDMNIFDLHDVIDNAEIALSKKFNSSVVIHMDPIDLHNKEIEEYKNFIIDFLKPIHEELSVHDFRIVPGCTHTNLIFDIERPYECSITGEELSSKVQQAITKKFGKVNCVITVDNPYF